MNKPEKVPEVDDLLLQEIQSLNEKIKILTKIVAYYEPEIEMIGFLHDIGTCDYQDYMHTQQAERIKELEEEKRWAVELLAQWVSGNIRKDSLELINSTNSFLST